MKRTTQFRQTAAVSAVLLALLFLLPLAVIVPFRDTLFSTRWTREPQSPSVPVSWTPP